MESRANCVRCTNWIGHGGVRSGCDPCTCTQCGFHTVGVNGSQLMMLCWSSTLNGRHLPAVNANCIHVGVPQVSRTFPLRCNWSREGESSAAPRRGRSDALQADPGGGTPGRSVPSARHPPPHRNGWGKFAKPVARLSPKVLTVAPITVPLWMPPPANTLHIRR